MSDKAELELKLSAEQLDAVSQLRDLLMPGHRVDSDVLMYRAGWAAAMAECAELENRLDVPTSKRAARTWSALAITFAFTTAACLTLMAFPSGPRDPVQGSAHVDVAAVTPSAESMPSNPNVDVEPVKVAFADVKENSTPIAYQSFRRKLFGFSVAPLVLNRNAELQKYLAEAVSPSRVAVSNSDTDWESEAVVPLTPASVKSFL